MPRSWRYRDDAPGSTHFVTVKGVGGLPIFSLRDDVRYFLSLLAREARAGALGVRCYAFVRNHAHFLLSSPHGKMHLSLQRILGRFAVYYNRSRDRCGHVFKDRFHSVGVRTDASFFCHVRYTDDNPVRAGLVSVPTRYEAGSAHRFTHGRIPLWLDPRGVARFVPGADMQTGRMPEDSYLRTFGRMDPDFVQEFVERRERRERVTVDPLDWFLAPDREKRISWLVEQARVADGTVGARLLARPDMVKSVVEEESGRRDWSRKDRAREPLRWRTLLVGLLRLACARSCREVAAIIGAGHATVARETRRHLDLLKADPTYLLAADRVLAKAVSRTFFLRPPFDPVGPDGKVRNA